MHAGFGGRPFEVGFEGFGQQLAAEARALCQHRVLQGVRAVRPHFLSYLCFPPSQFPQETFSILGYMSCFIRVECMFTMHILLTDCMYCVVTVRLGGPSAELDSIEFPPTVA